QFGKFKFYHACTILLAMTFVGIKSYEYRDKFKHYEIRTHDEVALTDGTIVRGMIEDKTKDTVSVKPSTGKPGEYQPAVTYKLDKVANVTNGKIVDGHVIEKNKDQVKLEGRYVEGREELYDLKAHKTHEHKEISIPWTQIQKIDNYGPWHNTYLA